MSENNLESSLLNSIASKNIAEIIVDAAEISLDHIVDEGLLKDIPVFGTLYKTYNAVANIRQRFYIQKLLKFLSCLKSIPSDEREQFLLRIAPNSKERNKVGQKLILHIEQADEIEKAEIIGRLFEKTIKDQLNIDDFYRLASMVQKTYLQDLLELKNASFSSLPMNIEHLHHVGFARTRVEEDKLRQNEYFGNPDSLHKIYKVSYQLNEWALMLKELGFE